MSEPTAIVLVAHGSPDPDWRRPIDALAARLRQLAPARAVQVAYLGFLEPSLPHAIAQLLGAGHRHVLVLSAFLSPGGKHIKDDVPRLVREQAELHPELTLELRPGALGAEPELVEALAVASVRALQEASAAHGSAGASTNADASTS